MEASELAPEGPRPRMALLINVPSRHMGHKDILKIEDTEIELMEQAESVQKQVESSAKLAGEAKKVADGQLAGLTQRETALKKELAELESNRQQLTVSVDGGTLTRYERLLKQKGGNVVVGVTHGVCGGCHMRIPTQAVVTCQAAREIVSCPNCGRLLYYTSDMDLAVAD